VTVTAAFDPADGAFVADPYPAYAALRAAGRVLYDQRSDHWLVPHHADVSALLRDRRFGRTYLHVATHAEMGRPEEPDYLGPFWYLIRNGMLDREPPDHTRLRRLPRLAPAEQPAWKPTYVLRGLQALRVAC
jgi:cytochrome P450